MFKCHLNIRSYNSEQVKRDRIQVLSSFKKGCTEDDIMFCFELVRYFGICLNGLRKTSDVCPSVRMEQKKRHSCLQMCLLPAYLLICLSVYLSTYLTTYLQVCLPIYLSVCLSACMSPYSTEVQCGPWHHILGVYEPCLYIQWGMLERK